MMTKFNVEVVGLKRLSNEYFLVDTERESFRHFGKYIYSKGREEFINSEIMITRSHHLVCKYFGLEWPRDCAF